MRLTQMSVDVASATAIHGFYEQLLTQKY